jgi:hypothetical protein
MAAAVLLVGAASAQDFAPAYEAGGDLRPPAGYETWVFVGSNLGLDYKDDLPAITAREAARGDVQMFHNVFIDPAAYAAFAKTGDFPDPTILIMEVYLAEAKDPGGVLEQGLFNGGRVAVEAAVKDSKRPTRPGSKEVWAYYDFPLDGSGLPTPAPAKADAACFACHEAHASHDNVWTQFYPVLRRRLVQ